MEKLTVDVVVVVVVLACLPSLVNNNEDFHEQVAGRGSRHSSRPTSEFFS